MKLLIFSYLSAISMIHFGMNNSAEEPVYTFIKKDKGIALFYRWVNVPNQKPVRELKAEFDIYSSPEQIITVLKNEKLALQWMKGVSEIRSIGKSTAEMWHTYIQYNIPWPLSNQDCIVRYDMKREPSGRIYNISMNGVPDHLPVNDGITRIKHLQGSWKLVPHSKNHCKVVYTVYSKQPPKFPRWITDPIIQGNLINTMEAFKITIENIKL